MIGSTNRSAKRTMRRAKRSAVAGTAAAAMALGLAGAPAANAAIPLNIDISPAYTAGAVAGLLNLIGNAFPGTDIGGGIYKSGPPQTVNYGIGFPYAFAATDVYLNVNLSLFLKNLKPVDTQSLYNTIAAIPQGKTGCGGTTYTFSSSNPANSCRFVFMLATSEATRNLANVYRAQIASVTTGSTPGGYIPFQQTVGATAASPTQTNQALGFLQNPLRPNGGFFSRFPGLSNFIGQDPTMPAAGKYLSEDGTIWLNSTTIDASYAYDPNADFPVVSNIFSILNSLDAFLPVNLAGGLDAAQPFILADQSGKTADVKDVGLGLAELFQVPVSPVPALGTIYLSMTPGTAYYATIVPKQLPIFGYMRLPALLINAALGAINAPFRVGTPWSDALTPAMKILVNIGYDDVVTPQMIADDPATYGSYQPYDRTFLKSGAGATVDGTTLTYTPFGSVSPLTPEERSQVIGDVTQALVAGFKAQFAKPLFGYIVPASSGASSAAAKAARVATPAAAEVTDAPTVDEPAPVEVTDIGTPMPSLLSGGPVAAPKQGSLRASRGKSEGQSAASRIRRPAAASVAGGNDVVKPAAAGKSAVTR